MIEFAPAGSVPIDSLLVCLACGAIVADRIQHSAFHHNPETKR